MRFNEENVWEIALHFDNLAFVVHFHYRWAFGFVSERMSTFYKTQVEEIELGLVSYSVEFYGQLDSKELLQDPSRPNSRTLTTTALNSSSPTDVLKLEMCMLSSASMIAVKRSF